MKNCFWKHQWSKWKVVQENDLISVQSKGTVGRIIIQERICEKCNKKELDSQSIYL